MVGLDASNRSNLDMTARREATQVSFEEAGVASSLACDPPGLRPHSEPATRSPSNHWTSGGSSEVLSPLYRAPHNANNDCWPLACSDASRCHTDLALVPCAVRPRGASSVSLHSSSSWYHVSSSNSASSSGSGVYVCESLGKPSRSSGKLLLGKAPSYVGLFW